MNRARLENGELNLFFHWAYKTRANTVKALVEGRQISPEKMFLSFTSHDPVFLSYGPAGLNGSVKGIGFIPRGGAKRRLFQGAHFRRSQRKRHHPALQCRPLRCLW